MVVIKYKKAAAQGENRKSVQSHEWFNVKSEAGNLTVL